jgi:hypothetical protein
MFPIRPGDVAEALGAAGPWDGVLLDVDNGPDGVSRPANARLYGDAGLAALRAALRPGGVVGVWSAFRDDAFTARLCAAGFDVTVEPVRSRGGARGSRHVVWVAARRRARA